MKVKRFTKDKESIGFIGTLAIVRMNDWIGSMLPKGIDLCAILPTIDKTEPFELVILNDQEDDNRPLVSIPREDAYITIEDGIYVVHYTKRFNPRIACKKVLKALKEIK